MTNASDPRDFLFTHALFKNMLFGVQVFGDCFFPFVSAADFYFDSTILKEHVLYNFTYFKVVEGSITWSMYMFYDHWGNSVFCYYWVEYSVNVH